MSNSRSFKDYIANRFDNELFNSVNSYLIQHRKNLNLNLYNIEYIDYVELQAVEVKQVYVNDLPGSEIEFDILAEADFTLQQNNNRYGEKYEDSTKWFKFSCKGDLKKNLDDCVVADPEEYMCKTFQPDPMSDSLVPIIYKNELEKRADDFLDIYCKEAKLQPMSVDPIGIAKKMGLTVKLVNITEDFSVFGQVYFYDCDTEIYDDKTKKYVPCHVPAKTVLVDPKAYFLRNLGAVNNTIIHECVHWWLHRKAFELERLYNEDASSIKCKVVGGVSNNNKTSTDWMEWQANKLAPRIQMPLAMFKRAAANFISQYRKESGKFDIINVIEPTIDALASYFSVSRLAAKIRMIDAGYPEAAGAFIFLDGHYVKPYTVENGALKDNQTVSISVFDAAVLSTANPDLHEATSRGDYIYVDSHFVLNTDKYIRRDFYGSLELTDYARTHMDECCIIFDISVKSGGETRYHSECFLNRDENSNVVFSIDYTGGYENSTKEKQNKILNETIKEDMELFQSLPNDYIKSWDIVMKARGLKQAEIADRAGISEKTVERVLKGAGSLNSVILMCLALHLPYDVSMHLIDKSPFDFSYSNQSHVLYHFAIQHLYPQKVESIKAFLAENGADPL